MDILGWDCPAPSDDWTNDFADNNSYDNSYDLWELNCCVVRDAYRRGDTSLWNCVFAFWDEMLPR